MAFKRANKPTPYNTLGKKPKKQNLSVFKPDIIRLAIAEHGPGNEKILCLLCLIRLSNLYPGSDIKGVPASDISDIILSLSSSFKILVISLSLL